MNPRPDTPRHKAEVDEARAIEGLRRWLKLEPNDRASRTAPIHDALAALQQEATARRALADTLREIVEDERDYASKAREVLAEWGLDSNRPASSHQEATPLVPRHPAPGAEEGGEDG